MTEDEQLQRVCEWNSRLSRDVSLLALQLRSKELEISALEMANADLLVERDATDVLLGEAMDELLSKDRR
jgi:hypothetical protein